MWTKVGIVGPGRAVFRCDACNGQRFGKPADALTGRLRCYTCRPRRTERVRKPKEPKPPKPPKEPKPPKPPKPPKEPKPPKPPKEPKPKKVRSTDPPAPTAPRGRDDTGWDPPVKADLEGRLETSKYSYTRVARFAVEEENGVEHGRLELAGLRSRNPLNRRLSWQMLRSISEGAKRATFEALSQCIERPDEGHDYSYLFTLSRVSTAVGLDDDGVTAALKGVRDACAIFVRLNDGNRRRFRVLYGVGHDRVQGLVLEWERTEGPFEDEAIESYTFFDEAELLQIATEHRGLKAYWKHRRAVETVERKVGADAPGEEVSDELDSQG